MVNAVQKVKERIGLKNRIEQLRIFNEYLRAGNNIGKIVLPGKHEDQVVQIDTITYCESQHSYTIFHFTDGKQFMVSRGIREYVELLPRHQFFRIHKSYLINLQLVTKVIKTDGVYVVINHQHQLPVARRKKDELMERINQLV